VLDVPSVRQRLFWPRAPSAHLLFFHFKNASSSARPFSFSSSLLTHSIETTRFPLPLPLRWVAEPCFFSPPQIGRICPSFFPYCAWCVMSLPAREPGSFLFFFRKRRGIPWSSLFPLPHEKRKTFSSSVFVVSFFFSSGVLILCFFFRLPQVYPRRSVFFLSRNGLLAAKTFCASWFSDCLCFLTNMRVLRLPFLPPLNMSG